MSAKKLLLGLLFVVFLAGAATPASAEWWNSSWHFRVVVNASSASDWINGSVVAEDLNFTSIIESLGSSGTFNADSLRVIEGNYSHPYDFDNTSWDTGNITWIANGTTSGSTNRTFYIYFDISENGAKAQGTIMSDKPYWRSGYPNDANIYSNQSLAPGVGYEWNRSWAEAVEITWKWSTESGWDYAYIYMNGAQMLQKDGNSSATNILAGNRTFARFTSDSGTSVSTTDSYGTYGAAIDRIKFLPTLNYTSPTLNTYTSNEAQPLSATLNIDGTDYGFGETIYVDGYVYDGVNDAISIPVDIYIYYPNATLARTQATSSNGSGYYSDTISANFSTDGLYSVNVTAYNNSYGNGTNSTTFTYTANYAPILSGPAVTNSGAWGENFNYSISITDSENNTVNVSLWINRGSGWLKESTQEVVAPSTANWTVSDFSCVDIGVLTFMFEYRDNYHSWSNTTGYGGPTISGNAIRIDHLVGNASSVNRTGTNSTTLGVRLYDLTTSQYVENETLDFWVDYNGTWANINSTNTSTDGNVSVGFDPTCAVSAGARSWKANYSQTCYQSNTSSTFSTSVYGLLSTNLSLDNTSFIQGNTISVNNTVTDECSNTVSGLTTGVLLNGTYNCNSTALGSGVYQCQWASIGKPIGNYSIRLNATGNYYLDNTTMYLNAFTLNIGPPIVTLTLSSSQVQQEGTITINASVLDQSLTGIEWVKINITRPNAAIDEGNFTNTTLPTETISNWTVDYPSTWGNNSQRGTYNISVVAKDYNNISGNATDSFIVFAKLNVYLDTLSNSYTPGRTGSIIFNSTDLVGSAVVTTNNFSISNPTGYGIALSDGENVQTNANGVLILSPTFSIPSDAVTGTYTIFVNSSYEDALVNVNGSALNNATFLVVGDTDLSLKIETVPFWYSSNTARFFLSVYNADGILVAADAVSAILYDPAGNVEENAFTVNTVSDGLYYLDWAVGSTPTTGQYRLTANATINNLTIYATETFRVSQGGPFEFGVYAPSSSYLGQDMTFTLNATNEGEVSTESEFTCWIAAGNTSYSEISWAKEVQAAATETFTKDILIPGSLSPGEYILKCQLHIPNSQYSDSLATDTFTAEIAPVIAPIAEGGEGLGGAPPPREYISSLEIVEAPSEILVESGAIRFVTVVVKNTGETTLHNIRLVIEDLPEGWGEIKTPVLSALSPGKKANFIFELTVGKEDITREVPFTVQILADEAQDEEVIVIRAFSSREELLLYKLEKLKNRLDSLTEDALLLAKNGQDTTLIRESLLLAKDDLDEAEKDIYGRSYAQAIDYMDTAEGIMDRAEDRLILIPEPIKFPFATINISLIVILIAIIAIVGLLGLYSRKMIGIAQRIRRVRIARKEPHEAASEEEGKILRHLKLIESQYNKGLLSNAAYEELKQLNERKLSTADTANRVKPVEMKSKKSSKVGSHKRKVVNSLKSQILHHGQ